MYVTLHFGLFRDYLRWDPHASSTMLPVVEGFIAKHPDTKPIVVADAAILDDDRLAELREKENPWHFKRG